MIPASLDADWGLLKALVGDHLHPGGAALTRKLLDVADPPVDGVLLDVGAGRGETLRQAKARWPQLRAFGVDPQATASQPVDGIQVLRGSATEIPWPSASVDVVVSECAMCLAESWEQALLEARRVLRPGGRLVFSDFYAEGPIPSVPKFVGALACLRDVRSGNQMTTLLESAGFSAVRLLDESSSVWELEQRVQGRMDVRGLLGQLAQSSTSQPWRELHEFLEDAIRARNAGALRYGIFLGTK